MTGLQQSPGQARELVRAEKPVGQRPRICTWLLVVEPQKGHVRPNTEGHTLGLGGFCGLKQNRFSLLGQVWVANLLIRARRQVKSFGAH